jgi:hypothetical protein
VKEFKATNAGRGGNTVVVTKEKLLQSMRESSDSNIEGALAAVSKWFALWCACSVRSRKYLTLDSWNSTAIGSILQPCFSGNLPINPWFLSADRTKCVRKRGKNSNMTEEQLECTLAIQELVSLSIVTYKANVNKFHPTLTGFVLPRVKQLETAQQQWKEWHAQIHVRYTLLRVCVAVL